MKTERGFTLIELMIVISIILILISIAVPLYGKVILTAREAVLRDDLFQMRQLIQQYVLDKHHAPQTLQDLVAEGHLYALPEDPITHSDGKRRSFAAWYRECAQRRQRHGQRRPGV